MAYDVDRLVQFLNSEGFSAELLAVGRCQELAGEWARVYGQAWAKESRMRIGSKALYGYEQQTAALFRIVPLVWNAEGPPDRCPYTPRWVGLECKGAGALPELSEFHSWEFHTSPPDLAWTVVHTHEDFALGGPYFIRREWAEAAVGHRGYRPRR